MINTNIETQTEKEIQNMKKRTMSQTGGGKGEKQWMVQAIWLSWGKESQRCTGP